MRASLVIDIDCCAGPADAVAEQCFLALNSHYKRISISKPLAGWLSVLAESQIHRQPQIWVLVQDPPIAMPSNESVLTVSQLYSGRGMRAMVTHLAVNARHSLLAWNVGSSTAVSPLRR